MKEGLKVTCFERKYRVQTSHFNFTVIAKSEFGEDATSRLLHEDMELKTFLDNHEITDIEILDPFGQLDIVEIEEVEIEDVDRIAIDISSMSTSDNMRREKHREKYKEKGESHIQIMKDIKLYKVSDSTYERRKLFDELDLPKSFTSKQYTNALDKKGIKLTNIAMPYDDLEFFEKVGKVKKLPKKIGVRIYWEKIDNVKIGRVENTKNRVELPIFI